MSKKPEYSTNGVPGIILGAILIGRTREVPVNYFPDSGVVMAGLKPLGNAKSLDKALDIARTRKKFRQSSNIQP